MNRTTFERWWAARRFGVLYAMAALAIFAGLGVATWRWIDQRRAFLESNACMAAGHVDGHGPWLLQLLGEPGFVIIKVGFAGPPHRPLSSDQEREVDRIRKLFPEADVEGTIVSEQPFDRLATPQWPRWR